MTNVTPLLVLFNIVCHYLKVTKFVVFKAVWCDPIYLVTHSPPLHPLRITSSTNSRGGCKISFLEMFRSWRIQLRHQLKNFPLLCSLQNMKNRRRDLRNKISVGYAHVRWIHSKVIFYLRLFTPQIREGFTCQFEKATDLRPRRLRQNGCCYHASTR